MRRRPGTGREKGSGHAALVAIIVACLTFSMMQALIAPILPHLQRTFDVSHDDIAWLMSGYLLTACISVPVFGRLGDLYGSVRMLRVTISIFAAGMLLGAMSHDFTTLLVARLIQGIGGATVPLSYVVLRSLLPAHRVAGAFGLVSSTAAFGAGVGIVGGGAVVEYFDFHIAFWIAGVIGALAAVVVFVAIPRLAAEGGGRVDWIGIALFAVFMTLLLLGITWADVWGWLSLPTLAILAGGVVVAAVWTRWEMHTSVPMVDIGLMRLPAIRWANVLALVFGVFLFSTQVLFPAYLQTPQAVGYGFGLTIGQTSLALIPQTLMFAVGGLLAGIMDRRLGSRRSLTVGSLLSSVGFVLLCLSHYSLAIFVISVAVIGLGIGLTYSQITTVVIRAVPGSRASSTTGANTNIRNVGGALGTQLIPGILVLGGKETYPAFALWLVAFALLIAAGLVGVISALMLPKDAPKRA